MKTIWRALFGRKIDFRPIDPLGNGLYEEIIAERREPQAIQLDDNDQEDVVRFWHEVGIHSKATDT